MRTSRVASVAENVAELMDVEAVMAGSQSCDPTDDSDSASCRRFSQIEDTADR